jgi:hypothetical protein
MKIHHLVPWMSLSLLLGCGGGEPADPIGTAAQAFGETACAAVGAQDLTAEAGTHAAVNGGYNNPHCYKSYLIDIDNYVDPGWPDQEASYVNGVLVQWNDTVPTTGSACTNLFLATDTYVWSGGAWKQIRSAETAGFWDGVYCAPPWISLTQLVDGTDYRFVVTARTADSSGAPTKAFILETTIDVLYGP